MTKHDLDRCIFRLRLGDVVTVTSNGLFYSFKQRDGNWVSVTVSLVPTSTGGYRTEWSEFVAIKELETMELV